MSQSSTMSVNPNTDPDDIPLSQIQNELLNLPNTQQSNSNTTEQVPLSILLKFIAPYSGERATLQSFIRNCQNAYDLATVQQRHILFAYICSQLRDKAELAVNNHNINSWPDLKEFLINSYSDKKLYGHLLLELQACKQFNHESITEFTQRLETCTTRILQSARATTRDESELKGKFATINQIALQTFIIGIKNEISLILRSRGVNTLSEAHEIALNEEKTLNFMRENSKMNKFCVVCKKSNHTSSNCFHNKPPRFSNYTNKVNTNVKTESINQISSQYPTDYNKNCNYCKKKGHVIAECRKRAFVNKKKLQSSASSSSIPTGNLNSQVSVVPTAESRKINQIMAEQTQ